MRMACVLIGGVLVAATLPGAEAPPRFRQPVALALADNGAWLYVANRRSGTITAIDTARQQVREEIPVGRQLADVAMTPDGRHLLAVDEGAGELVVLACDGAQVKVRGRLAVGNTPVSVCALDAKRCSILLLWPRRVVFAEWQPEMRAVKVLDLPFAPRRQVPVGEGTRLIVADAFGGQLGVVNVRQGSLEVVKTLPAHNLRGLARHGDGRLLVAHQHLSNLAQTTRDDIHWGSLLANQLRFLKLASLLSPDAEILVGEQVQPLGDVDHGAGDPAAAAVAADGTILVTLAGTDEVSIRKEFEGAATRLSVGRRPTALAVSPDGHRAYVANTLSDSVSVIDMGQRKVTDKIALGPQPEPSAVERGERLFFDARLSLEGWFSCHSCHTDGHSNGRLNDNLGDNSFGAPKRVLSLLGAKDSAPYAWNGQMADLEGQIRKSVATTMHGPKLTEAQASDLAAFVRSLPAPPGVATARGEAGTSAVRRGEELFRQHGCVNCHTPPTYTSSKTYQVGLHDEVGNQSFNPPSLRGVSQGGPYFHDGRAATLDDVLVRFRHQLKEPLPAAELAGLLSFLRSL